MLLLKKKYQTYDVVRTQFDKSTYPMSVKLWFACAALLMSATMVVSAFLLVLINSGNLMILG